jgi:hypothetical protein
VYVHVPIGSMYGIYANIGGILMVNVTIYSIHGSYGVCTVRKWMAMTSSHQQNSTNMPQPATGPSWLEAQCGTCETCRLKRLGNGILMDSLGALIAAAI